jgi:hypothetical protein
MVVILLALMYVLLAGSPKPMAPAKSLFAPVSVEQALSSSRPVLSSFDFIFRPVFAIKRVPPEMPTVDGQQDTSIDELPLDEVVEGIDGVSLLGIFGSGEVAGVIIRLDNGDRQRLPVGESVKGLDPAVTGVTSCDASGNEWPAGCPRDGLCDRPNSSRCYDVNGTSSGSVLVE